MTETPGAALTAADTIARLRATAVAVLDRLLEPGMRYALVDYPDYGNVGDSAIWLGQRAYLRLRGLREVYACAWNDYRPDLLHRARPDVVLVQGGGNFGDLWQRHQRLREQVLATCRDLPVVQLPQTVWFEQPEALDRARAVIAAHPDVTLLVRDEASLALVREAFGAPAELCPDSAALLGTLARPEPPHRDVLWLVRTDKEARDGGRLPPGVAAVDWLEDVTPPLPTRAGLAWRARRPLTALVRRDLAPAAAARLLLAGADPLAEQRLARGLSLLGSARVVVTDRLHAHLLCLALGIPHVVLDNRYGKVAGYVRRWTGDADVVHWADSPEEAAALVPGLLSPR